MCVNKCNQKHFCVFTFKEKENLNFRRIEPLPENRVLFSVHFFNSSLFCRFYHQERPIIQLKGDYSRGVELWYYPETSR